MPERGVNRLWYVWTEGYAGATGERPSGPIRQSPVLAASKEAAVALVKPKLTSWDGAIRHVTTEEDYAPRRTVVW